MYKNISFISTLIVLLAIPAHGAEVSKDRFTGAISVHENFDIVNRRKSISLNLIAQKEKGGSTWVTIEFYGKSESWEYLRCHDVDWLADATPIDLGDTTHSGHVGNGYVLEFIRISNVSLQKLSKLSTAKTVDLRICASESSLSPEQIAQLADFVEKARLLKAGKLASIKSSS